MDFPFKKPTILDTPMTMETPVMFFEKCCLS